MPGCGRGNSGFPIPSPSQPGVFLTRNAAAEAAAIRRLERSGFTEIIGDERILRGGLSALAFLVETVSEDDPTLLIVGEPARHPERSAQAGLIADADRLPCG